MKVTLMEALDAITQNISVHIDSSTNNISVHLDHSSLKGMRKYIKKLRKKEYLKLRKKENQKIRDAIEYRNSQIKRAL